MIDIQTDTHTDAGNDNTRRPRLASGKNAFRIAGPLFENPHVIDWLTSRTYNNAGRSYFYCLLIWASCEANICDVIVMTQAGYLCLVAVFSLLFSCVAVLGCDIPWKERGVPGSTPDKGRPSGRPLLSDKWGDMPSVFCCESLHNSYRSSFLLAIHEALNQRDHSKTNMYLYYKSSTHGDCVTHMNLRQISIIGFNSGFSPVRCQGTT